MTLAMQKQSILDVAHDVLVKMANTDDTDERFRLSNTHADLMAAVSTIGKVQAAANFFVAIYKEMP